jgi:Zn-dependent peptidase ImmA (M78 family)
MAASDLRLLALASELGRMGGHLLDLAGHTPLVSSLRQPRPVSAREEPWKQGYSLGEAARRVCKPATGPIRNLESILRSLGVHVADVPFSDRQLDAASLWEPGAVPIILINSSSAGAARTLPRRAALAHELCHLLHDSGENDMTTQLSWDEERSHGGAVEQRARAFGPAFLARPDDVRTWFRRGRGRNLSDPRSKVVKLAERWGLSYFGAIWHAKNCGIIQSRTAHDLKEASATEPQPWAKHFEIERQSALARLKFSHDEMIEISDLGRGLIAELAADAATAGSISQGRAREILAWGRI